jgi:hypothetical protein
MRVLSRLVLPLAFIFGCVLIVLVLSGSAWGHFVPGRHNAVHAIQMSWCGKANRVCWQGNEAIRVAKCESAWYWTQNRPTWAVNGQYVNLFQMGYTERRLYGWHVAGSDPWTASRAAHYYWVVSGRDWSPWTCKP